MGQSSSSCVMPHAATLTSTSQATGLGSGASSKTSPLMPVRSWMRMAFIARPLSGGWRALSSPTTQPTGMSRGDLWLSVPGRGAGQPEGPAGEQVVGSQREPPFGQVLGPGQAAPGELLDLPDAVAQRLLVDVQFRRGV